MASTPNRAFSESRGDVAVLVSEYPPSAHQSAVVDWLVRRSWMAPAIAAVWFFAKYSVDVPYLDQWGLPYVFRDVAHGRPLLPLLLQCDNEHPIIFPKLIWIALAFITKWNTRVDMAVSLLFTVGMFVVIARMACNERQQESPLITGVSVFVASLLVFAFVHYDVWLWGFELTFVMANTFTVWAIYLLWRQGQHPVRSQLLAWCCCIVASFSALYGMASWLVIIPMQWTSIANKRRAAGAAAGSVMLLGLCIAFYYLFMVRFPFPVDRTFWYKHPLAAVEFLFTLVGAPLARGGVIPPTTLALVLGAVLIVALIVSVFVLFEENYVEPAVPWISISLFGLAFCAMNTLGHSAWGVGAAASMSRYMNAAVLLALGVIQLGRQAMRNRPWTFATIACIAGALSIAGSVASLHMGRTLKRMRGLASACLEVERYIDPATDRYPQSCLFPLFPMTPGTSWVRPSAEVLGQLGFRKIATHAIFVPNPPVSYGSFETAAGVGGTPTVHNDSAIRANGWIISRVNSASPPLVLISVDQAHMFVAAALAGLRNSATALRGGETVKLWSVKVPAVFLPHGMSVLHAWLYRADAEEFDQLTNVDGEHRVDRTP